MMQVELQAFQVHRVDRAEAVPKRFNVVQSGDYHQTLWSIHYTVMGYGGWSTGCGQQGSTTGREVVIFLFLIDGFTGSDGNGFVEAQASAIVPIGIDVR